MSPAVIGSMVGVAFGFAWGLVGAFALPGRARFWGVAVSAIVSAGLLMALAMHQSAAASGTFKGGIYGIAVSCEAVAIIFAVIFLRKLRRGYLLVPTIGFIVGLHFIGLWKATDLPLFAWMAVAMCAICVVAALLPRSNGSGRADTRIALTGFGCATVLWAAGFATLLH